MKYFRPGIPQQLVFVGMLLGEADVPAIDFLERRRRKALLVDPLFELFGQRHLQGLLIAETLVNRGRGRSGLASHGPQRQTMLAARTPKALRGLQDTPFRLCIYLGRHGSSPIRFCYTTYN